MPDPDTNATATTPRLTTDIAIGASRISVLRPPGEGTAGGAVTATSAVAHAGGRRRGAGAKTLVTLVPPDRLATLGSAGPGGNSPVDNRIWALSEMATVR
ncbi:hypothetical protein MPRM_30260 [Mycobacterium parmense]|uniref:Uncharacterized protein n=1 Tax=Mycobacterium parmense TaxID=185642 RepID=A0A7I7YV44_9MYCO|nr:hypothetical protein MPRM_30260 [Mycobacterium parmense]